MTKLSSGIIGVDRLLTGSVIKALQKKHDMSRAFVKEGESEQLREIAPTIGALEQYLRRENGGVTIREMKSRFSEKFQREVHDMSDGLSYGLDEDGRWQVYLD